jgi:hypothetical protein
MLFPYIVPTFITSSDAVGGLRQRDGAPKLSGNKFIQQAGNNSAELSPKAEP